MPNTLIWEDDHPVSTDRDGVMAEMDGRYRYFFSRTLLVSYPNLVEKNRTALTEYIRASGEAETAEISTFNIARIVARRRPTVAQKVDRLMRSIARHTAYQSEWLTIEDRGGINLAPSLMRDAGIGATPELVTLLTYIGTQAGTEFSRSSSGSKVRLSIAALIRLEGAEPDFRESKSGFVAMWFGNDVAEAYASGIAPAIEANGYDATRIDGREHNNKIDDEIIAEIRRSRFVVADFTCGVIQDGSTPIAVPRGGVYYEAGFAQGLGIPVVWCVRADQINAVHFDTRQFNHIVWSDSDDLRVKLTNRIGATIGRYQN